MLQLMHGSLRSGGNGHGCSPSCALRTTAEFDHLEPIYRDCDRHGLTPCASRFSLKPAQVPQVLGNPGSYPPGYVKFAAGDPDNQCVLPNGHYRARQHVLKSKTLPHT